jgi:hypothetical protein
MTPDDDRPGRLVRVRDAAVAVLRDYGTIAEDRIEAERIDPVGSGDMPRVSVFADESGETASRAGTAPAFDMTGHLVLQCLVERATKDEAIADLDLLIWQVKEALFSDAAWVKLTANIASVTTQRSFRGDRDMILGDGRLRIDVTWRDLYPPRITQMLSKMTVTVAVPATTS